MNKNLEYEKFCLSLQSQSQERDKFVIAQLVEQRTENPCVPGSIPGDTTLKIRELQKCDSLFLCRFGPCFKAVLWLKVKPRVKPEFTMNAGINILCYKSKTLANGEHPLMFRVCKDGKKKYVSLGVSVAPQYWDFQKNKPKRNCPNRIVIEKLIAQKSKELSELVLELEADNKEYTAATLVEKAVKPKAKTTVGSLMQEHIKELRDANRTGYALSMEQVYNSLIKFNGHLDMPFSDIDIQWLKKYEQWLRNKGLADNTIGIRFRTLRRIYNIALERKLVKSEDYPFKSFGVSRLHQQTPKRAIKKENIYKILNYPTDNKRYYYSLAIDLSLIWHISRRKTLWTAGLFTAGRKRRKS